MGKTPLIVGISGGSAAGKTTVTGALAESLKMHHPVVLNQDHYFRDWEDVPTEKREAVRTSNHPRAVLWDALIGHVQALRAGAPIVVPVPGTRAYKRGDDAKTIVPDGIVFVEGHLIFGNPTLRDLFDVRLFLDVDTHERVLRRMMRDTARSGMTLEGAVAWYRKDVIPNYPVCTTPTRQFADVVVPFEGDTQKGLDVLANGLNILIASTDRV